MNALAELETEKAKRTSDNLSKAIRDSRVAFRQTFRQTYDENEEKRHQEIIDSGKPYVKITCQENECTGYYFIMLRSDYDEKPRYYRRPCKMCTRRLNKQQLKSVDGDIVGDKYWKKEFFQGRHS